MSLFVVESKHPAETCPAGHPEMAPMLVQHVSQENASNFGVTMQGHAIVDGAHTFYLILEADSDEKVKEFMAPFFQVGTVEILPASSCEQVVARASC